jgi:predicted transcriptional regulator of viral defense system
VVQKRNIDLPTDYPFDYQVAMQRLAGFDAPRNKLAGLSRSGEIVRVKKGLYVSKGAAVDRWVLAGLIYGSSYVSLEAALSHHGLIPERVDEVTCISTKRPRLFKTPMGRFSYRAVTARVFLAGVALVEAEGGSYLLASPEKALCDRVALVRNLRASVTALAGWLAKQNVKLIKA